MKTSKALNIAGLVGQTLLLMTPFRAHRKVARYYQTFLELFSIVGEHTGFLNIGYTQDPEKADLLTAQKSLVRRTTRDLPPHGRWLDVGCGTGQTARLLAQENRGLHITGIDIMKHQNQFTSTPDTRVDIRFGNAMDMPFETSSFDGVYAIETAFHYPDKDAFVREAFRVLAPGGSFALAEIVWKQRKSGLKQRWYKWLWCNLIASPQIFSEDRWKHSLATAGFSDIFVEDISKQTLGLYPLWIGQVRKHRKELSGLNSACLVDISLNLFMKAYRHLPFRYILMTGEKKSKING